MADLNDKDCFDEESCRFFLREVGARVVPNYPFSYGMEEVHSLIIEQYGYEGIPDVTSVLQELLEEDDAATGIGDDGDIWRSWRHNWRHRNVRAPMTLTSAHSEKKQDNALDPFVPKVGNFILKHPTSKALRRIKADNFLRKLDFEQGERLLTTPPRSPKAQTCLELAKREDHPKEDDDRNVLLTSATYSHQRCRLTLPLHRQGTEQNPHQSNQFVRESVVDSVTASLDSQQDFAEVTASMLQTDFDPSILLSFEIHEPWSSFRNCNACLRGGHAPICTLQPIRSGSAPSVGDVGRTEEEEHSVHQTWTERPVENPGNDRSGNEENLNYTIQDQTDLERSARYSEGREATSTPCGPELVSKETSNEHYHSNANCVTPAETPEPERRRTANRHARLIDGAIFPFKSRKSTAARSGEDALSPDTGKRSLFRLSWTPTRQSSETRRSWLQGIRTLFGTSQNKQQKTLSKHRHKSSIGNTTDAQLSMSKSHKRVTSSTANIAHLGPSHSLGLCLDGACDELPSPSTSYLNKPLPLNPDEIARSMSSGTRSTSIDRSHTLSYQPHSASTTSTKISQASSKRDFQAIAKDLSMTGGMLVHQPDLSPVHEARLNPSKYDPLKSPRPPYS